MRGGIASRFAVFISLVVLLGTVTVGIMVYRGAKQSLMHAATDRLAHTTETIQVRIDAEVSSIAGDVRFLASTPPVQGIVRARLLRGLDPETSIRDDEWGVQLAEIFKAFLENRPSYLRASLIGMAGGGYELVRVERDEERVAYVDPRTFQRRSDEDYFRQTTELAEGEVYLSEVQAGGEDGLAPGMPVLYAATPIYSRDGQLFGIVVITVNFNAVLALLEPLIDAEKTLYVASSEGDYLFASGWSSFERRPPRWVDVLAQSRGPSLRMGDVPLDDDVEGIAYFDRLPFKQSASSAGLVVGVTEPHETILSGVRAVRNRSALITVLLCLGALIFSTGLAGYLTQPLRQITKAVASFGKGGALVPLPDRRSDEIGVLARTFEDMAQQIQDQMHELRQLTDELESRVQDRTREVRKLASTLTVAEQEERQRISQILHDDLQQRLYSIQMRMGIARRLIEAGDQDKGWAQLDQVHTWIRESIALTRNLTVDLSPPVLNSDGFAATLEWTKAHMQEMHNMDVEIDAPPSLEAPDKAMRVLLFQIVRELLFNVVKHGGTRCARVEVRSVGERIEITVADQGKGFDVAAAEAKAEKGAGFGLFSVRERLGLFGGRMHIDSAPGQGTRITVDVPMQLDKR